jgi:hypothetical protein
VGFVVDKVALGQDFVPGTSVFPCQFNSTGAPLHGKTGEKIIIFITGLYNKPQGCGASVASAAGGLHHKKKTPSTRKNKNKIRMNGRVKNGHKCMKTGSVCEKGR